MLFCHLDGEPLDLFRYRWPTELGAAFAPVELLRNQLLVPAQEGVGCGNRGDLFEAFPAKRVSERSETTAFRIGEAESAAAKLGFEDTVFCEKIGDDLLLVTLEPASDHGDEDLENHSYSSG
jgi:hypothetical protein